MSPQTPVPHAQQSSTGEPPEQSAPAGSDSTARIDAQGLSDETRPVPRDRGPIGPEVAAPGPTAQTTASPAGTPPAEAGAPPREAGTPPVEAEDAAPAPEDGETQDIRFAPGEAPAQLPPPADDDTGADDHTGVLPPVTDGPAGPGGASGGSNSIAKRADQAGSAVGSGGRLSCCGAIN